MVDRQGAKPQERAGGLPTSAAPARLGRYKLLQSLAMGGMAEIHLGSFEGAAGIAKLVAIKRIRPERAHDAAYVSMFLNEARIAATLNHPNLVQTYDSGCEGGHYFLAMEYLRGEDLLGIVRALAPSKREMPLEVAVAIVLGVAAGLHYFHEKRDAAGQMLDLVHRDISPGNIFVTADGAVKIVDFGIAKAIRRVSDTREGTLKGNVGYMSPEQCRTERLDRRTDIFSLSIVLWELTVGRRLFDQASEIEAMKAISGGDVPAPSRLKPGYPAALERIVQKGLARDREQRYRTADEMQIDLERFAFENNLVITPRNLSSFVRTLLGNKWPTIAALDPDPAAGAPDPAAGALSQAAPPPSARASEPTRAPPRPRLSSPGTVERPARPHLQLIAVALFVVAGGLGGAWLATRHRADATAHPAAEPPIFERVQVDSPSAPAAPPIPERAAADPGASPAAAPSPADLRLEQDPGSRPDARPKREGARRRQRSRAPAEAPTPEAWGPDSALLPP